MVSGPCVTTVSIFVTWRKFLKFTGFMDPSAITAAHKDQKASEKVAEVT